MSKEQIIKNKSSGATGRVSLVGAGPGAADLVTVRGQRALAAADVVVYDDLVNAELLELCPPEAKRIYVGKRAGRHCARQDKINRVLVREARAGKRVVRLKGGDPLVFGRGGEEMQELAMAGISCEVVPGVTSAVAAGASAGIPLTHRDYASAVVFVTGHECAGKQQRRNQVDWVALARTGATLCIYMGLRRLPEIVVSLTDGGLAPETPLALVARATLEDQTVRFTDLRHAVDEAQALDGLPTLVILGEVVRWAELTRAASLGALDSGSESGRENGFLVAPVL